MIFKIIFTSQPTKDLVRVRLKHACRVLYDSAPHCQDVYCPLATLGILSQNLGTEYNRPLRVVCWKSELSNVPVCDLMST